MVEYVLRTSGEKKAFFCPFILLLCALSQLCIFLTKILADSPRMSHYHLCPISYERESSILCCYICISYTEKLSLQFSSEFLTGWSSLLYLFFFKKKHKRIDILFTRPRVSSVIFSSGFHSTFLLVIFSSIQVNRIGGIIWECLCLSGRCKI